MIRLYTAAYGNSGMNARQVLEEMVCDAMGKMNAFATEETSTVAGEVGQFLRDLRKTAKNEALNSNNAVQDANNETPTSDNGIRDSNNEAQTKKQKNNAQEGVKFSRELTTDGRVVAVVDEDILSNLDLSNWNQETKEAAQKAAAAALLKFQDGIAVEGITRKVNRISRKEFTRSEYTNELFWWNSTAFLDKMRAANNLDDVVIATTDWARDGKLKNPRTDNFVDFDHGTTLIASGDAKYEAEVVVGITDKGDAVFYDIVNMKQGDFSIKKKESSPTATTNKSPGSIFEDSSKKNVAQQSENVKQKYSRELDSEYMELAKDPEGNREKISRMVAEAARAAGYDSPLLYHGTQSFGFTQFDLSKMDDGQSIFLTSNPDIASTYSGVGGKRDISNASRTDVSKLSIQEVAKMLNQFPPESGSDYSYSYVSSKADIEKQVDSGIAKLNGMIPALKSKYAEDSSEISKLNHLRNLLFLGDRSSIATALWTISRKFDIFDGNEDFINNLEQNIRLLGKAPSTGGFVVEKFLGGYSIEVLKDAEAREALQKNMQRGNYGLYAKLGNFLTVDGNGNYWNDLKNWAKAMEVDEKNTYVMEDNGWFYLLRTTDDSVVENGFVSATKQARALSQESLHSLLIQKANTSLRILAERTTTTRGVAKWAKNTGYDSVIFKDIKDSGGQNDNVGLDTTADVYVIFNPNDAKSADAVTYDDNGKVIPLSERFNSGKRDIRYSRELETVEALKRQNEILQKQRDYWKEQTRTTDEKTRGADKGEVRSLAGQLIRQYSSKTEVEEILPEMQWLADSIWKNDPKISYTDLQDSAQNIARMVLDGSEVNLNAENWETGQELKRFLRGRYINVDESLKEDIGDFKNFKRSNRSLHFRENGTGTGVDSLWLELQNDFGKGLFPDSVSNPGDKIRHIADTLTSLTESDMRNPYAADMELTVEQMAYDVMARAAGLNRQKATKADNTADSPLLYSVRMLTWAEVSWSMLPSS